MGGQFKAGETRTFIKVCDTCNQPFESRSGSRKRCPDCCKCEWCGVQLPDATDRFCGNSCAGKWKYRNSQAVRDALVVGRTHPNRIAAVSAAIIRDRKGKPAPHLRGPNNPNWKGGAYRTERHTAMGRVEYIEWRTSIFERDDYTCQECGDRGGKLNAHHTAEWANFPGLRYHLENGITLCVACHKKRHASRA